MFLDSEISIVYLDPSAVLVHQLAFVCDLFWRQDLRVVQRWHAQLLQSELILLQSELLAAVA